MARAKKATPCAKSKEALVFFITIDLLLFFFVFFSIFLHNANETMAKSNVHAQRLRPLDMLPK